MTSRSNLCMKSISPLFGGDNLSNLKCDLKGISQCNEWKLSFQSSCLFYYYLPLLIVVDAVAAATSSLLPSPLVIESKVSKFQCIIIINYSKTWFVKRFASAIEKFNWFNTWWDHWCVKNFQSMFLEESVFTLIYKPNFVFWKIPTIKIWNK